MANILGVVDENAETQAQLLLKSFAVCVILTLVLYYIEERKDDYEKN